MLVGVCRTRILRESEGGVVHKVSETGLQAMCDILAKNRVLNHALSMPQKLVSEAEFKGGYFKTE